MSTAAELRRALLAPSAIAIVGASDDVSKTAARPLQYLRRHGFAGRVYPINARRERVMGERAYVDIDDVPETVDHAFIALPTEPAIEAAFDCAHAGVKLVTVLADGFAEAGPEGLARQRRLTELTSTTGCRIIGPNSLGIVRTSNGLSMTANAAFAVDALPVGRTSVLSQSGSLIGTLFGRGRARGIGFANLISVGNEADLSIGELGELLVADGETDAFILFLETIRHREKLERFAWAAAHAKKPILAYKLGKSKVGAELAVSHTGALVGSDAAADRLLRDLGIARVEIFEALLEAPPLFASAGGARHRPKAATILTTTGGGGAMVADRLGASCVDVRGAPEPVRTRLAEQGIRLRPGHIIDVSLVGAEYATMRAVTDELLRSPDIGALVAVIGSSAEFFPERALKPIIDSVAAATADRPAIAVFAVPGNEQALRMLSLAGIAGFRTPEACADAVRALLAHHGPAQRPAVALDGAVFRGLDAAPERLNEREALAVFNAVGIASPRQIVIAADGSDGAGAISLPPFPVVAKLLSRDLPHKTESGGVVLDLMSADAVADAARRMVANATAYAPHAQLEGILVQEQVKAAGEVLIGLRRDPAAGPVVSVGLGGIEAELHRDVAVRLAPISCDEALAMIDEVRALARWRGYRGRPPADVDALAAAIVSLSTLAAHPRVLEAEINPLLVRAKGSGVVAVDGLIVMAPREPADADMRTAAASLAEG